MRWAMILRILRHGHEVAGNGGGRRGRGLAGNGGWGSDGSGAAAVDEIEDILLGDAATGAGSGDLREIDIVFAGEFADERRRTNVGILFVVIVGSTDDRRRSRNGCFLFWEVPEREPGALRLERSLGGRGRAVALANHTTTVLT